MQLAKPNNVPRVYVTATDKVNGKSKGITVYNTTPEQFIEHIRSKLIGETEDPKPRRRQSAPSAA